MTVHAVIPIKQPALNKTRMAPYLSGDQRTALARHMLDHVIAIALSTGCLDEVILLSPERYTVPASVRYVPDAGIDLNAALIACLENGLPDTATVALILFADLPLLSRSDVAALAEALTHHPVALAPDHAGTGTNAVAVRLPSPFRFQFGNDSLERHLAEARAHGLGVALIKREGLARDVDCPPDLAFLGAQTWLEKSCRRNDDEHR